ncbi:MAG: ATP-grasp domain-containing protein [Candidatus Beckwithbacteria bacterium]|nr:ATP-grasp domain-containing protein [Candidatus Beckwithbacteria bacterium]
MKIAARFENLKEIKKLFPKDFPIIGVGVTAWPRVALAYLLPNFSILSYLETSDLEAIRKLCPVVSMEKNLGGIKIEKENTSTMLETEEAQNFFDSSGRNFPCSRVARWAHMIAREKLALSAPNLGLFVYKGTVRIDKIVEALNLKLMSTAGVIRNPLENKRIFREELVKAGIEPIQGESLKVKDLSERKWEEFKQQLGEKLVFQLADSVNGGGAGTFFIRNKQDFRKFRQIVREKEIKKDKDLEWVNVTKFIEGEAASIIGCVTRYGVVCGRVQKQIIDQPELGEIDGRAGVWQGHDWIVDFEEKAQKEAEDLCKKWGEHIYKKGYKGIFGLDVIVSPPLHKAAGGSIVPIECNARYTGAFPVLTMMQVEQGIMPFDVWHLAEWLGLDYEMDLEEVNKEYCQPMQGAQLVMHSLEAEEARVTKKMKAGVYRFGSTESSLRAHACPKGNMIARANPTHVCAKIQYVRDGFSLLDLKSKDEFVLADRVVEKGSLLKSRSRMGRLVFKRKVVDKNGRLLPEIREVIRQIIDKML